MVDPARVELAQDGFFTITQASQFSSLCRSLLYNAMARGELPYAKVGTCRRIPRKALLDFMARHLVTRD